MADAFDALLDDFQRALAGRDDGAFAAVCAPDVHYEDPLCAEPLVGPAALVEHLRRLWAGVSDVRVETTGPRVSDGRFVAGPCKVLGTHTGTLGSIPPTRRPLAVHVMLYVELDPPQERLWRVRAFFDLYDAAVQVGVLPARNTLAERTMLMMRGFGLRAKGARGVTPRR
ncbi:MAG: nuclear transport factor 2 family protein [Solirubrobacteraceae bacterium]